MAQPLGQLKIKLENRMRAESRMREFGLSVEDAEKSVKLMESGIIIAIDSKMKQKWGVIDGNLKIVDIFPRLRRK